MDYLEVIKKYLPESLLNNFSQAKIEKTFTQGIIYKTLYSEFSKLAENKSFNEYSSLEIDGSGKELLEIFSLWSKGKIPVLENSRKKTYTWELPQYWQLNNIKDFYPIVFYTSGTSGEKKPLVITLENIIFHFLGVKDALKLDTSTIYALNLPTQHLSGLMPLFRAFFCGGSVTPFNFKDKLNTQITHLSIVNSQLDNLIDKNHEFKNLKSILVGGGQADFNTITRGLEKKLPISLTYGLSEMSSTVTIRNLQDEPFSVNERNGQFHLGGPLDYRDIVVENNEVICSGKTCYLGYFKDNKFKRSNGKFKTSDRGVMINNNFLFESRTDNIFISGGKNVSTNEIKKILNGCPFISESHIKVIKDKKWGQRYALFYRPTHDTNDSEEIFFHWCQNNLKKEQAPKKLISIHKTNFKGIKPSQKELNQLLEPSKIIFIHGLFGSSSDWSFAQKEFPNSLALDIEIDETCETFEQGIELVKQQILSLCDDEKINLIGYSMGGRIGFHLLKKYPNLFNSLVMISSDYLGISDKELRKNRLKTDKSLLSKIDSNESYNSFLKNWYNQSLFGDFKSTNEYKKRFENLNSQQLATNKKLLTVFSTGNQPFIPKNDYSDIENKTIKYIYGSKDKKYKQIALDAPTFIKNFELKNSSHACHVEQKDQFLRILKTTLC